MRALLKSTFLIALTVLSLSAAAKDPRTPTPAVFEWSPGYRLSWDDFRGQAPAGSPRHEAAITTCGMGYEIIPGQRGQDATVRVYNAFYGAESWVRTGHQAAYLLEHEQGHFDLCELYTRILRDRIRRECAGCVGKSSARISHIFDEVESAYHQRQLRYEDETAHGTIDEAQARWSRQIAAELGAAM